MSAHPSICLVGCGNMGGAMLNGWLSSGTEPASVYVVDPMVRELPAGVRHGTTSPDGKSPDILVLAIKPQMLAEVGPTLRVGATTIVISILAGVEVETLSQVLPGAASYVRVMPNMAASIGEGVSAVYGPTLEILGKRLVEGLITPLGPVEWIADEALFHGVTGVSGSGPAFVLRFAEALAAGGAAEGLSPDFALRLALETLAGSARLALRTGKSPHELAESVRSPNGTTHAGLTVMDGSDFAEIVRQTVSATANRSRELAKASRKA